MYCSYCGKQIQRDATFCNYCGGAQLPATSGGEQDQPTAPPPVAESELPTLMASAQVLSTAQSDTQQSPKKSEADTSHKYQLEAIVLISIVGVVAAIATIVWYLSYSGSQPATVDQSTSNLQTQGTRTEQTQEHPDQASIEDCGELNYHLRRLQDYSEDAVENACEQGSRSACILSLNCKYGFHVTGSCAIECLPAPLYTRPAPAR